MKQIKGFNGVYFISKNGGVFSRQLGSINKLKPSKLNGGYLYVTLYKKTKRFRYTIHRLVAMNYLPNLKKLPQVNHKDGNKLNNKLSNLEWCTSSENKLHSWKIGTSKITEKFRESARKNLKKALLTNRKFNEDDIKIIKELRFDYKINFIDLAKIYKVSTATIYKVVNSISYK